MIKKYSFLFFALLPSFLFSQKNELKNNKDISWIGETEFVYHLEDHLKMNFEPKDENQNDTRIIKIDPYATCEFGSEKFFTNYLMNEIENGKRKVFSTDGKQISQKEILDAFGGVKIDTVITFDPETFEERIVVVQTDPAFKVDAFKIKQWWYYNKVKKEFNSIVKSIGPMLAAADMNGNASHPKLLFWVEMEQPIDYYLGFNHPNVIWAKETINILQFDQIKKIKGKAKKTIKDITFDHPKKGKTELIKSESWYTYCSDELPKNELGYLFNGSVDTVITFDPVSYKESMVVVKHPKLKFKDFKDFRVHQHWYFDKEKNTLVSKVISLGPMQDVYDENGNFRFRKALFYIKN